VLQTGWSPTLSCSKMTIQTTVKAVRRNMASCIKTELEISSGGRTMQHNSPDFSYSAAEPET
jgi:hypothetical protein